MINRVANVNDFMYNQCEEERNGTNNKPTKERPFIEVLKDVLDNKEEVIVERVDTNNEVGEINLLWQNAIHRNYVNNFNKMIRKEQDYVK